MHLAKGARASWLTPAAIGLLGAAFLLLAPDLGSCDHPTLVTQAIATLLLAALPIRVTNALLPISLSPLMLMTSWMSCGPWASVGLALLAAPVASTVHPGSYLPAHRRAVGGMAGVCAGSLLGVAFTTLFSRTPVAALAGSLGFALGLWLGHAAVERLTLDRSILTTYWPVAFLTHLLLAPPAVFLAEIAAEDDLVPLVASLGLAVGLVVLIRAFINSETRTAELAEQVASSAQARDRLQLILDHAPEAIFGLDTRGGVRWLNRTAAEWLGESAHAAAGKPLGEALPLDDPAGGELDHPFLLARARAENRPVHQEGVPRATPGAPERVLVSYSADTGEGPEELGLVLLRDASEVSESLREQEELAVHLSHELRAPLTTILGYAQLMAGSSTRGITRGSQAEFAKRISESGDYMLRLVNNLLDLGRLAREDDEALPAARVDALTLTREVIDAHRPQADSKAQELEFEEPPAPIQLVTSDLAVRQILTNLISNAIKYTPPEGHVRVSLSEEPEAVVWKVVDDGIGLSSKEQHRLFTRFFRSQRPEARLIKGTGLGLSLTKALIERLGGSIEVESALDRGSAFTVRLPRA